MPRLPDLRLPSIHSPATLTWPVILIGTLGPPLYIFLSVLETTPLPEMDYWWNLRAIFDKSNTGELADIGSWVALHNEHPFFLTKVIYFLNVHLSHGSSQYLSLWTFLMAAVQAVLLIKALPPRVTQSSSLLVVALPVISCLTFTPQAVHNWMWGMSGTAWMTANTVSIACFAACAAYLAAPNARWAGLALLLGLTASVTYGTGLLALPVAAVILLCLRPPKFPTAISLGALSIVIGYAWVFRTPGHHPAPVMDLTILARYVSGLLGRMWTENPDTARTIGIISVISAAVIVTKLLREKDRDAGALLFWVSVLGYALGNAVLIAVTRAGFGNDPTVGLTRYAGIRALFWIAWVMIVILALLRMRISQGAMGALQIFVASGLVLSYANAYDWAPYRKKQRTKELAAVALRLGHTDESRVSAHIFAAEYFEMIDIVPLLRNIEHYPFNASFSYDCRRLGTQLSPDEVATADTWERSLKGSLGGVRMLKPDLAELSGWAYSQSNNIECVVVVDAARRVVGATVPGFPRPDVSNALKMTNQSTGWVDFAQVSNSRPRLTVLARLAGDPKFYPLGVSEGALPKGAE